MRIPLIVPGVALVLALTTTGCTNGSSILAGGADLSPTAGTSSSGGSPTPEPTTTSSPTPAPQIEDGRHFVFVKRAKGGGLTFDLAEFYTGEEANQIAGERGDEVPVPNDVYIVNDNPKLRTVPVAGDAKILVLKWSQCCDVFVGVTYDVFAGYLVAPTDDFHGTSSPYWIRVRGGQIVKIEEQYLP
jgi:hypothetical protein